MSHGFFTDTTLCIGCKACEVACKQWNQLPADGYKLTNYSYDNTVALSSTTWRHVAFVEQTRPANGTGKQVNWLMMSDVCKHCTHAGCMEGKPVQQGRSSAMSLGMSTCSLISVMAVAIVSLHVPLAWWAATTTPGWRPNVLSAMTGRRMG